MARFARATIVLRKPKKQAKNKGLGRMPGSPGNVNAVRHGQRSKRHGLVHAKLGRRFANAYGHANQLRKAVRTLVAERHGSLSLLQQAKVQSLLRLEEGIRACEKLIAETPSIGRRGGSPATLCDREWTIQRDSLLAALLGDAAGPADPWAALAADRAPPSPSPVTTGGADGHQVEPIQENATVDAAASGSSDSQAGPRSQQDGQDEQAGPDGGSSPTVAPEAVASDQSVGDVAPDARTDPTSGASAVGADGSATATGGCCP